MLRGILTFVFCLLALMVNVKAKDVKVSAKELQQEANVRKYNKLYLEAMCQKAVGNRAAEFDLLQHALKYCPDASETIFELACLKAMNPMFNEEEVDSLYRVALALDPTNSQYQWEMAKHELTVGKMDSATVLLEKLTKDPAKRYDAYSYLATVYERTDKDTLLLNVLGRWEAEEGGEESISLAKYRAYSRLKRYDDALALLDTMCSMYPQSDYYPVLVAETYLSKGDTAMALQKNSEVEQRSPGNSYSQLFIIRYYQMAGNQNMLDETVERIILNPKQEMGTRTSFFQTYIKTYIDKQDDKITSLFKHLQEEPMESTELLEIYVAYLAHKKAADSVFAPVMHKILEVNPSDRASRIREISALWSKNDVTAALKSCDEGIKYNKDYLMLYIFAGNVCLANKDFKKAEQYFKAGMPYVNDEADKNDVSDYFSVYGDVVRELGNKEESYALYDSSLVYNPSNSSTLNNYAYYLSLDGEQLEKAKNMASLAVRYEPENGTFLDTYAWVLFVMKNYEDARVYIEKAVQYLRGSNSDANIYEHAGDIYIQLNMNKEALEAWNKAKQMGCDSETLNKKIKLQKYIE